MVSYLFKIFDTLCALIYLSFGFFFCFLFHRSTVVVFVLDAPLHVAAEICTSDTFIPLYMDGYYYSNICYVRTK